MTARWRSAARAALPAAPALWRSAVVPVLVLLWLRSWIKAPEACAPLADLLLVTMLEMDNGREAGRTAADVLSGRKGGKSSHQAGVFFRPQRNCRGSRCYATR